MDMLMHDDFDAIILDLGRRIKRLVRLIGRISLKSVPARVAAALLEDRTLRVVRRETRENLLTGEITESFDSSEAPSPRSLGHSRAPRATTATGANGRRPCRGSTRRPTNPLHQGDPIWNG